MRVPLAWLRDYVELPGDVNGVVDQLARLGFPVESVEDRPRMHGVVVGTIVALKKHPYADRLQLCTLDVGAVQTLTIATAATNVALNQVVPVATIGAQLAQMTIGPRKMLGIDSQGMLCSAEELALTAEWFEDGILQLDRSAPNGTDVIEMFGLSLAVLDVEIGANRGDALSMVGIARELAAGLRVPLQLPASNLAQNSAPTDLRVTLESRDVRRYLVGRVGHVQVETAPTWLRVRLALAGQRPISNLVDISNFVMLEVGQPLHFFDHAKIVGNHLVVRDAVPGERLITLDGVERQLDPTALVIADDRQPMGLAGLMGGQVGEVDLATREIAIESANFVGARIRRMSLRLGLRTEASTRGEKDLAPALAELGWARAAFLLAAQGATIAAPQFFGQPLEPPTVIELGQADVQRLLGLELGVPEIRTALEALGFGVTPLGAESEARLAVTVPEWRSDIAIAADLVEEVARIIGYDHMSTELPPVAGQHLESTAFDREMLVAQTLVGLGYAECLTLALQPGAVAERWRALNIAVAPVIEIRNPLSEDQRYMRFSILPALLAQAAREPATRPLRSFEIGHVFADAPEAPREANIVTLLATTKRDSNQPAWRDAAFLAMSADVRALIRAVTGREARLEPATAAGLHPGKTARLFAGEYAVGFVGAVDPRLVHAQGLDDDVVAAMLWLDDLPPHEVRRYVEVSKYPALERDIALIVDPSVTAAQISQTVQAATPFAREVEVFDEYRGPQIEAERKSLAVRIVLQRSDGTLTDADANAAMSATLAALKTQHGATLRQ